jgi:hypothetical protein
LIVPENFWDPDAAALDDEVAVIAPPDELLLLEDLLDEPHAVSDTATARLTAAAFHGMGIRLAFVLDNSLSSFAGAPAGGLARLSGYHPEPGRAALSASAASTVKQPLPPGGKSRETPSRLPGGKSLPAGRKVLAAVRLTVV